MALAMDFWRNEQMLNIFRTKPCKRLAQDGVCEWKSQCQFAHYLEWPRRPPWKYNYSPVLCPRLRVTAGPRSGTAQLKNCCTVGLRCPLAHSKEEVLFHPDIFKTILCEEHANQGGNQRNTRSGKRRRCHRYYCPFAHGAQELRTSALTLEQREQCLRALDVFPSDDCCAICTRHWITPEQPGGEAGRGSAAFGFGAGAHGLLQWPQGCPAVPIPPQMPQQAWPFPAGLPRQALRLESFTSPDPSGSSAPDPLENLRDLPAFIHLADDGSTSVGLRQPTRAERSKEVSDLVYTML